MLRFGLLTLLACALLLPAAIAQVGEGSCVEDLAIQVQHDERIVTLTWSATAGAAFYDVHRAVDGGPSEHLATVAATETTFVDDPAPEGIVDYRVAANGHPADTCPAVSAHLGGEPVPPGEPVCASDLEAEARADGSIRITWAAVPGAEGYDVLRATGDDALAPYAVVGPDATEFVDTATTPGVVHRYAVVANGLPAEGQRCEEVAVVAVPEFPHVLVAYALVVAVTAGLVLARR